MMSAFTGLIASIGLALVITALVRPGTQTRGVIDATSTGLTRLTESSLGIKVL